MKKILYFLMISLFLHCGETNNKTSTPTAVTIPDTLVGKDLNGDPILVGKITLEQLKMFNKDWLTSEYDRYKTQADKIEDIASKLSGKKVVLFMGTWCEDSQREVPAMIKILDQAGYPTAGMEIVAIDEPKEQPAALIEQYDITYIPALLFFENDEELNRIVEFPIGTLEEDILAILNGEPYKNAYAE